MPNTSARLRTASSPVRWVLRRVRGLLGAGARARQSLTALGLNSAAALVAGLVLGSITETFRVIPGLLVLVPAAVGLRGNIFSTFGNRVSTALHTGQLELTLRPGSILRENVDASMVLTVFMSAVAALMAWLIALAVGVEDLTSPLALVTISVLGGIAASLVVLLVTLGLTVGAVRYRWDLDNVVAPVVSTVGDLVTLPALWATAVLIGRGGVSIGLGAALVAVSVAAFAAAIRSHARVLHTVVAQSWPVLSAAALLSTFAGIALEGQLETWTVLPALLVLQPAFVSSAGALGSILSSRIASRLHLGQISAGRVPDPEVRADALFVLGLAVPVYLVNGVGAHVLARLVGEASPGALRMVGISLAGGMAAVLAAVAVAYYATVASLAIRVDPDTYGIPVVTSTVDFAGVVLLIAAVAAFGVVA